MPAAPAPPAAPPAAPPPTRGGRGRRPPGDEGSSAAADDGEDGAPRRRPKTARRAHLAADDGCAAAAEADEGSMSRSAEQDCMENIGLSWNRWHRDKEELAICWAEQKWSDLITSRLGKQVSEACVEHGQLLRRLQQQQASIFDRVVRLHSDSLWQLDRATAHIAQLKRDEATAAASRALEARAHAASRGCRRIAQLQQQERDIEAGAMRMASEKVDRMGATLSTMRDLYQDLRSNAQSLNAFDLKDAVTRLETKLSAAISELSELRLLRDEAQSAKVNFMITKVDLQAKKALIERQKIDLRKRGKLVHELMIAKGELQAELESRDATTNEEKATHGEEGEVTDVQPPDDVEEYAQNAAAAILDQSVLCVRCGRSLDHLTELTRRLAIERRKRVHCLGYRQLLPALKPKTVPPERSHTWALGCMRAILLAKVIDCQLSPQSFTGFPEFVHAFYAPQIIPVMTDKERKRMALMVQQGIKVEEEQDIAQCDLDRWSLYPR